MKQDMIVILDLGSTVNTEVARKIREMGVYSEIHPHDISLEELKKLGREDIVVIAGGVIPAQDYDFLYKAGVAAIFGPGTPVAKAACQILEILMDEE